MDSRAPPTYVSFYPSFRRCNCIGIFERLKGDRKIVRDISNGV